MTAISAPSANETPSPADPPALRTVLVRGSERTYANRDYLRGLGLRWDPEHNRWHGTTTADQVRVLREKLQQEVQCFGSLDPPERPEPANPIRPAGPRVMGRGATRAQAVIARDFSRTRAEARVVYRDADEGSEEIATPTRTFSLLDVTSGLQGDSREAEEREAKRRLRDLRGRVKAARAVTANTPALFELLARAAPRAGAFCARHGIAERELLHGDGRDGTPKDTSQPGGSKPTVYAGSLGAHPWMGVD